MYHLRYIFLCIVYSFSSSKYVFFSCFYQFLNQRISHFKKKKVLFTTIKTEIREVFWKCKESKEKKHNFSIFELIFFSNQEAAHFQWSNLIFSTSLTFTSRPNSHSSVYTIPADLFQEEELEVTSLSEEPVTARIQWEIFRN